MIESRRCRAIRVQSFRRRSRLPFARRQGQRHAHLETAAAPEVGAAATDYLRLFALVAFGWMWARMAAAAAPLGDAATRTERRKPVLAQFFVDRMLPQSEALSATLAASAESTMVLEAEDL